MTRITDAIEAVLSVIRTMNGWDVVDIALLAYIIFYLFKLVRETRAGQLFKGIAFLLVIYLFGSIVKLKAITYLLERLFSIGLLAILIVFQPEVRRTVEKLGHSRFGLQALRLVGTPSDEIIARWKVAIEEICDACVVLSDTTTGALIVIEQQTRLGEQIENGTVINATPSVPLFGAIFYPKNPLHDGAVIMRDGMVLAAACFLPKPQKEEQINKALGSRHRAAIGMSENSDAIVIVVSEETGQISVAENGVLTRNYTRGKLHELLTERLIPQQTENRLPFSGLRRGKRKGENDET